MPVSDLLVTVQSPPNQVTLLHQICWNRNSCAHLVIGVDDGVRGKRLLLLPRWHGRLRGLLIQNVGETESKLGDRDRFSSLTEPE